MSHQSSGSRAGRLGRPLALGAVAALAAVALAACGEDTSVVDVASTQTATPGAVATTNGSGAAQVSVDMLSTADGDACAASATSVASGPVTFTIKNSSATGITEFELLQDQRIVGEKENVATGLDAVRLTMTLDGGDYQLYCPGAAQELTPFTVTGDAAPAASGSVADLLEAGTKTYARYVDTQTSAMVVGARKLQAAVEAGDLAAARLAYADARIYYERIESDVAGFVLPGSSPTDNAGNLDYLVDMRASNLDPKVGWHGFHAVERDLFGRQAITAQTKRYAVELTGNVVRLSKLVRTLDYQPEDLANGAAALLEEVQANKISGEEEAFSHIDLVDFAGDLEGAQQSFANLEPGLTKIDPALTTMIAQRFTGVSDLLDTYRDPSALGGYRPYTAALRKSDANKLSQTVQGLQDALSRLAEKVATA